MSPSPFLLSWTIVNTLYHSSSLSPHCSSLSPPVYRAFIVSLSLVFYFTSILFEQQTLSIILSGIVSYCSLFQFLYRAFNLLLQQSLTITVPDIHYITAAVYPYVVIDHTSYWSSNLPLSHYHALYRGNSHSQYLYRA
jgi:hypothetical protein